MLHVAPKFLVISTVNDRSLHKHWAPSKHYDTCLIYYGDNDGFRGESTYYFRQKGPKFTLIDQILKELPEYHYYWMPDDDVFLEEPDVLRLFNLSVQYYLDISQPAIAGYYGPSCTLCVPECVLRYTNWVEIMCPVMSRRALQICRPTFTENRTGWSIDAAWNVLLEHPRNKIAIIDDVVAIHTRPVFGGDVYKKSNPLVEGWNDSLAVRIKYNLNDEALKDIPYGKPLGSGEIFGVVVYDEVKKNMEEGIERPQRIWPPVNSLWSLWSKQVDRIPPTRGHIPKLLG